MEHITSIHLHLNFQIEEFSLDTFWSNIIHIYYSVYVSVDYSTSKVGLWINEVVNIFLINLIKSQLYLIKKIVPLVMHTSTEMLFQLLETVLEFFNWHFLQQFPNGDQEAVLFFFNLGKQEIISMTMIMGVWGKFFLVPKTRNQELIF